MELKVQELRVIITCVHKAEPELNLIHEFRNLRIYKYMGFCMVCFVQWSAKPCADRNLPPLHILDCALHAT